MIAVYLQNSYSRTTVGWLSKLAGSHSTRVTDNNMQCHAVFKLVDKPGKLMKVLIILKVYIIL